MQSTTPVLSAHELAVLDELVWTKGKPLAARTIASRLKLPDLHIEGLLAAMHDNGHVTAARTLIDPWPGLTYGAAITRAGRRARREAHRT